MAAISHTTFRLQFSEWKDFFFIKISLKYVLKDPIDNHPVLV